MTSMVGVRLGSAKRSTVVTRPMNSAGPSVRSRDDQAGGGSGMQALADEATTPTAASRLPPRVSALTLTCRITLPFRFPMILSRRGERIIKSHGAGFEVIAIDAGGPRFPA